MTVRELIEWLKTQDQGAIVEVMEERDGKWEGSITSVVPFSVEDHVYYSDLRCNDFVKDDDKLKQVRTLTLAGTLI